MANCPCGLEKPLKDCCGPILSGKQKATTAEALMRSRYTAYTQHQIDHIAKTNAPNSKEPFDRDMAKNWAEKSEWLGLEVLGVEAGQENDETGAVEFVAHFKLDGEEQAHHEVAFFQKIDGAWYYVDGKTPQTPIRRETPKVGRNDPCTCGSGKKFKKCCARVRVPT